MQHHKPESLQAIRGIRKHYEQFEKLKLLEEIEMWSKTYEISFQFWGVQNNCFIEKKDVELHDFGGNISMSECLKGAVEYLRRINPKMYRDIQFKVNN